MNEKEMHLLETQLRSWQPRRPSPRVKRRIFGAAADPDTTGMTLRWLAPVAACVLLAVTIIHQEPGLSAHSSTHQPMMGMISSNLSYTNILPGEHGVGRNDISPASFEWTNLNGFTSSISPFSPGRVN